MAAGAENNCSPPLPKIPNSDHMEIENFVEDEPDNYFSCEHNNERYEGNFVSYIIMKMNALATGYS